MMGTYPDIIVGANVRDAIIVGQHLVHRVLKHVGHHHATSRYLNNQHIFGERKSMRMDGRTIDDDDDNYKVDIRR